ncbi:hypothetical protein NT6N_02870 [Oceaniferula spumae]|uniref:Uncharacterized protein n=1 Tax=Oceaniferula spumae TaxID=2979115 RepID=A0AAT9FGZ8_9BACT
MDTSQTSWSKFLYALGQDAAQKADSGKMPTYAVALPTLNFASPLIAAGFLTNHHAINGSPRSDADLLKSLTDMRGEHVEFVIKKGRGLSTKMGVIKGIAKNNRGEECLAIYYLNNKEEGKEHIAHIHPGLLHCVKLTETTQNIESRRRWLDTVINLKGLTTLFQGNEEAAYSLAGKPHNTCNIFDSSARVQGEVATHLPIATLIPTVNKTDSIYLGDLVRLAESTKSAVARSSNTTINPRTNKHLAQLQIVSGAIQSLDYDIFAPTGSVVFCIARTEPSFLDATTMINDNYIRRCPQAELTISDSLLDLKPAGIDICAWYR